MTLGLATCNGVTVSGRRLGDVAATVLAEAFKHCAQLKNLHMESEFIACSGVSGNEAWLLCAEQECVVHALQRTASALLVPLL